MYEYREYLYTAIQRGTTVAALLGVKGARQPIDVNNLPEGTDRKIKNEIEVLDLIIQRGFDNLLTGNGANIKLSDAMRAIQMKNTLTGGKHGGLTEHGLEELKKVEEGKTLALIEVIKKYVPEDKWEELDQVMSDTERKYYEENAPEYLDQYEQVISEEDS
jgi:hypothetical protein